jgi:uncharacterized protein (DUF2147 family)
LIVAAAGEMLFRLQGEGNQIMYKMIIAVATALLLTLSVQAADDDAILGIWNNQEKDAKIEIFKCSGRYCGKIVWLKEPNYAEGSKDGVPGTPKLDHNNPDPKSRNNPVIGLEIVRGFTSAGDNKWVDGKVYDPKNGKTYSGKMTLVLPNQLDLRGFIGISLLGRTTTWTR